MRPRKYFSPSRTNTLGGWMGNINQTCMAKLSAGLIGVFLYLSLFGGAKLSGNRQFCRRWPLRKGRVRLGSERTPLKMSTKLPRYNTYRYKIFSVVLQAWSQNVSGYSQPGCHPRGWRRRSWRRSVPSWTGVHQGHPFDHARAGQKENVSMAPQFASPRGCRCEYSTFYCYLNLDCLFVVYWSNVCLL